MSSKEQKTEQVVAEEEVDAKKDAVKGTKRPAEVKFRFIFPRSACVCECFTATACFLPPFRRRRL